MRRCLLIVLSFLTGLAVLTASAQAVVVNMHAVAPGATSVPFNASDQSGYYGVALVPGARTAPNTISDTLQTVGVPRVATSGTCTDPALTPDLALPDTGLCYHDGAVMRDSEMFALTWDPLRRYWSGTRSYLEQFLRDVADGSGTLSSPFALTTQYTNSAKRSAGKSFKYGGGCIDYGNPNQSANKNTTCLFGSSVQTGPGYNYPSNGCTPSGQSYTDGGGGSGPFIANDRCVTDAQLRNQVSTVVTQMGIANHTAPGYQPMIVLPTPPGVEVCLDGAGKMCSANGSLTPPQPTVTVAPVQTGGVPAGTYQVEISYVTPAGESLPSAPETVTLSQDSTVTISSPPAAGAATGWYAYLTQAGGTTFSRQQSSPTPVGSDLTLSAAPTGGGAAPPALPYFCSYHSQIQIGGTEWSYVVQPWTAMTQCDEPDAPTVPKFPPPGTLATDVGIRLASPLSQSQIASVVNPGLKGWFALDGSEIDDNGGCVPLSNGLDSVTVGSSSQNPYLLQREFNNAGVMENDPFTYFGCAPQVILTPSFVVPSPIEQGQVIGLDGSTTASTLIVPNASYRWSFGDGTTATGPSVVHSFAKAGYYHVRLTVTDRGGNVRSLTQTVEVLTSTGQPPPQQTGHGGSGHPAKLHVRLQLMPQSRHAVLLNGLAVRVNCNQSADGFATLWISRWAARTAHIQGSRGQYGVVVGRGTVSGIKDGAMTLRVRISGSTAHRLAQLSHLNLLLRLALVSKGGQHVSAGARGSY